MIILMEELIPSIDFKDAMDDFVAYFKK